MTPNQITDLLAMELRAEGNFPFKKAILERVNTLREQMLKRTLEKTPADRKFFVQPLRVPMENFNMLEGTSLHKIWSRSKCALPRPLRANSTLFDYVGSLDGANPFRHTEPGHEAFLAEGRYGTLTLAYRMENYRLVVMQAGVPEVLVYGIFADPEDAYRIDAASRNCTDCDYWEAEYPCSGDVLDIILQEIVTKWRTPPVNLAVNGVQNAPNPQA
jgi:hypothetical protein